MPRARWICPSVKTGQQYKVLSLRNQRRFHQQCNCNAPPPTSSVPAGLQLFLAVFGDIPRTLESVRSRYVDGSMTRFPCAACGATGEGYRAVGCFCGYNKGRSMIHAAGG